MLNQRDLIELKIGDELDHFLIINKFEIKVARNNKPYINLELRDKSSSLPAKIWDNIDQIKNRMKEGTIVKVSGQIEEFAGFPQIKISNILAAPDKDNIKVEDFMPKSERNPDTMLSELNEWVNKIENPYLKELIKSIFEGENFSKFSRAPAGKSWHHSYIHGLLEHTLEVTRICNLMCDIHSRLNRDLLITGALIHDFGKIDELSYDATFDYTNKGRLIGHITLAAIKIEEKIRSIKKFPETLKDHLLHLILSHQGKLEFASPIEPKTLEAIVLYQADEISAKTNAYLSAIKEDENKGSNWTRFLPLANTSLFIPSCDEETKND